MGNFVLIRVNFSHMSGPKTKAVWTAKHRPMRRLFVGHISTYRVDTPYSSFRKHKHINRRTTPVQWKHVSLIDLLAQRVCRVGSSGLLVPDLVFAVPELVGSVIADLVVPGEQRECSAGRSRVTIFNINCSIIRSVKIGPSQKSAHYNCLFDNFHIQFNKVHILEGK